MTREAPLAGSALRPGLSPTYTFCQPSHLNLSLIHQDDSPIMCAPMAWRQASNPVSTQMAV